jgi:hypothetical protein
MNDKVGDQEYGTGARRPLRLRHQSANANANALQPKAVPKAMLMPLTSDSLAVHNRRMSERTAAAAAAIAAAAAKAAQKRVLRSATLAQPEPVTNKKRKLNDADTRDNRDTKAKAAKIETTTGAKRSSTGKSASATSTRASMRSSAASSSKTGKSSNKENVKGKNSTAQKKMKGDKKAHPRVRRHKKDTIVDDVLSNFSGYSDDQGSVCSGLLEEGICFECGVSTNAHCWEQLIICDVCEGEYHIGCIGGEGKVPRTRFACTRCKEEQLAFEDVKFNVHDSFKVGYRCCHLLSGISDLFVISCLDSQAKASGQTKRRNLLLAVAASDTSVV